MMQEVMLAPSEQLSPEAARFPYLATPKIDGIRFYIEHGDLWSRANKSIPNLQLRRQLPTVLPDGVDGELYCGSFNSTQSVIGAECRSLEFSQTTVFVFDYVPDERVGYFDRVKAIPPIIKELKSKGWFRLESQKLPTYRHNSYDFAIVPLYPVWITSFTDLGKFYEDCLADGHEGIILRSASAEYKFGRATISEHSMFKFKPRLDREAIILGCEEKMSNLNPSVVNELGRSSRSSHQAGLVPAGTLGAFHVIDTQTEVKFRVGGGPGLTELERARLWSIRSSLPGMIIEYRCMPYGAKEKPRQPQYLGIKSERKL